jgi:hypothetical protein
MPAAARPVDLHRDSAARGHQHVLDQNGTYKGDVFAREAVGLVRRHAAARPLFVLLGLMQPHSPVQVPWP